MGFKNWLDRQSVLVAALSLAAIVGLPISAAILLWPVSSTSSEEPFAIGPPAVTPQFLVSPTPSPTRTPTPSASPRLSELDRILEEESRDTDVKPGISRSTNPDRCCDPRPPDTKKLPDKPSVVSTSVVTRPTSQPHSPSPSPTSQPPSPSPSPSPSKTVPPVIIGENCDPTKVGETEPVTDPPDGVEVFAVCTLVEGKDLPIWELITPNGLEQR